MIWLGSKRGYLTDWTTQKWVRLTGRPVSLESDGWLSGPVGSPSGIGKDFFENLAQSEGLVVCRDGEDRGLVHSLAQLDGPRFDSSKADAAVIRFYERTSSYEMDAWGEWCGPFRPFGWLLAVLFSRRLQQLNVPLSALDTSRGITSQVLQIVDPKTKATRYTAWVRQLVGTRNVLYAGSYSVCRLPGYDGPCVKVVFPLPNGNAIVIMKPSVHDDGSITVASSGRQFGDPGFYFTVHGENGRVWARHLRTLRESIHVYASESGARADHVLTLWRATFLRLHYRLTERPAPKGAARLAGGTSRVGDGQPPNVSAESSG